MLKYIAALLCIAVASPMAMAGKLDETTLDNTDPEFASLHYFAGDWRCVSNTEGPSNELTVLHIYGTLKHWYAVESIHFGAVKTEATHYISYNAHHQEFVQIGLSNHGGYGKGKAPGWDNGALVFTGYTHHLASDGYHWRKTLTKIDDTHFNTRFETSTDGQTYSLINHATCSK